MTYVSPGFEVLTGYRSADVLGRSCSFLQGPGTDPRAVAVLREALLAEREVYATLLNYRADGTEFWNEIALAPQFDADGRLVQYLGVQKDVTCRRKTEARVHELAYFDSLTGLANRATLHKELDAALHTALRDGTELALLFVDLDDFKRVNDSLGHMAGDRLLMAVADRLRLLVRPGDLVARQGGDEFTLLLAGGAVDVATAAADIAGRVVAALREPVDVDGIPVDIRASVGISRYPHDADTTEDLLRHADTAMYVAKGGGKDTFHVHRARGRRLRPAADEGFDLLAAAPELDRILAQRDVRAVYQPIVEIASGAVVAFEALARGPQDSELHRPDRMFATAVATGRVDELDWLCRIVAIEGALEAGLGRSATLFLNCEPAALGTPCPERYRDVWERAGRELDLTLEITERAVTDRPAELARMIQEHRSAQRGIALDDVGADVRSLALLPLVSPDVIKLDLSLVQDRPSTDQAAIVSAVAAERERTGAQILAEGIEDARHVAIARALGATLGQGWFWGRPGPLPARSGGRPLRRKARPPRRPGRTPFEVVAAERDTAEATKRLLLPISHHFEHRALRIGEGAVILSAFQDARNFTAKTVRRYETLARGASLVGAFGVGLGDEPIPGVRGAHIDADDPLAGEWSVVVLGPHFAGALIARDLGDSGADLERRFEFTTVYDRGLVIDAAQTLLERIAPVYSAVEPVSTRPA